jgi:tryptophanyl-tRNA synthetase
MVAMQAVHIGSDKAVKSTVLSGIKPTGMLHIGNYIGALSLWVEMQSAYNTLFCIANLHALTIPEDITPDQLRATAREIAALYIACGIDPQVSTIFLQSDVPAHAYLGWILTCCTPVGWLERMTQYKSKAAQSATVGSGLLAYPALQAADILVYKATYVPVGDDQKQHIELARDIAHRFNRLYGECFPLPEVLTRSSGARIMALDDPAVKMSKSLAVARNRHAVCLLDPPDAVRVKIMSAVTDSGSEIAFDQTRPGIKNLLVIYQALSGCSQQRIEGQFAGKRYGDLKQALVALVVDKLAPIQDKYRQITQDKAYIDEILADGAARASSIADKTLAEVRALTGV